MSPEVPANLIDAHNDGYRVCVSYTETGRTGVIRLHLVLWFHNYAMQQELLLEEHYDENTCLEALLPKFRRMEKLLQAYARYFNEGGDTKAVDLLLKMNELCRATVTAELVASESEETHARTFLLDDGNYLRVVEDDFTELMTPSEMQAACDRDQRPNPVDQTGLGLDLI
jgi:hypothetical protein